MHAGGSSSELRPALGDLGLAWRTQKLQAAVLPPPRLAAEDALHVKGRRDGHSVDGEKMVADMHEATAGGPTAHHGANPHSSLWGEIGERDVSSAAPRHIMDGRGCAGN